MADADLVPPAQVCDWPSCGCCDSLAHVVSIMRMLYEDGPDKIGQAEWDLTCRLLDEVGK